MKIFAILLVAALTSVTAHAADCRAQAVAAATSLYLLNHQGSRVTSTQATLTRTSPDTESGTIYVWDVIVKDAKGFESTTYRVSAIEDAACTVFEFSMPFAG